MGHLVYVYACIGASACAPIEHIYYIAGVGDSSSSYTNAIYRQNVVEITEQRGQIIGTPDGTSDVRQCCYYY